MSPFFAFGSGLTMTTSPFRMPASRMLSPLTRSAKHSWLFVIISSTVSTPSMFSTARIGLPAATRPTSGISLTLPPPSVLKWCSRLSIPWEIPLLLRMYPSFSRIVR